MMQREPRRRKPWQRHHRAHERRGEPVDLIVLSIEALAAEVWRLSVNAREGVWLAERVWEPDLPATLAMALIFGGGGIIAVIAIIMGAIRSTNTRKEFERSRREIAAYIAEGSMSPDDGERLLAQKPHK